MGIPASARAACEKTGALTGRVPLPLSVITTRQNRDKTDVKKKNYILYKDRIVYGYAKTDTNKNTVIR